MPYADRTTVDGVVYLIRDSAATELSAENEVGLANRAARLDSNALSGLTDDIYTASPVAWEQGNFTSTGEASSDYWIRTTTRIPGGFVLHNKNPDKGYIVARYDDRTDGMTYPWMNELTYSEYYYIPYEANYSVRIRQRYAEANVPLGPEWQSLEILRPTQIIPSIGLLGRTTMFVPGSLYGPNYSRRLTNVAGTGNYIFNLAASQWDDIPFGGVAVSTQYSDNYDLQLVWSIASPYRLAYRVVHRTNKTAYFDWIQPGYAALKGKKAAIIGDSRSTYSGTVPAGNATYFPRSTGSVLTDLSQMWWKRVLDHFGMTLTANDSYSGGYVANQDGNNGPNILSSDTAINNLGSTAPDIVFVFAGVNDWNNNNVALGSYAGAGAFPTNNATFREAYAIMLSKVQKKFPAADIWLCTNPYCCPLGTGSTISSMPVPIAGNGGTSLDAFNDAIRDMAGIFGCGVIEFTRCGANWGNLKTYATDYDTDNGLHYNAAGHELLANVAIKTLENHYKV